MRRGVDGRFGHLCWCTVFQLLDEDALEGVGEAVEEALDVVARELGPFASVCAVVVAVLLLVCSAWVSCSASRARWMCRIVFCTALPAAASLICAMRCPKLLDFWLDRIMRPRSSCRQRVQQLARASGGCSLQQAVEASSPDAAACARRSRSPCTLMSGETGVCGPFCGFGVKRARRLPDSLSRAKNRPFRAHGRQGPMEKPLERRDWNQAVSCGLESTRARSRWGCRTPRSREKDRLRPLRAEGGGGRPE